ncbi:hypothetical protein [Sphingomonas sp. G-3-2-10]|uniref:hypothetical protein n=1 Tax=Sphingomonas sp. G-3-2-10 TaxID=2728838 RepID=UPI00146C7CE8|nr:hypothetical protein [Sphingomonas sp. G-3-2-10]NML06444.1 hypothetical protein [Sphingomonas sp. G-3-2-10]
MTRLWFSMPRATAGFVFAGIIAGMGLWLIYSFHVDPDQAIGRRRGEWMSAGNGAGGVLLGLAAAGFGLPFCVSRVAQVLTRRPAFAITPRGIAMYRFPDRTAHLSWHEIDRVKVERRYVSRRIPFAPPKMYAELALYLRGQGSRPKIAATAIEGGLFRTCRFARAVDRALTLHRDGELH